MDKQVYRILDVNLNRSKEGLRVLEDIVRFSGQNRAFIEKFRRIRYKIASSIKDSKLGIHELYSSRNTQTDCGKGKNRPQLKQKDISDLFISNSNRVKESLRVLEEFCKLADNTLSEIFKNIRFNFYVLEKDAFKKVFAIRNNRS